MQEFLTDAEDDDELNDLLSRPATFSVPKKANDASQAEGPQANKQAEAKAAAASKSSKQTASTSPSNNNNSSSSSSSNTKSILERATETARIFLNENIASKSDLIPPRTKDLLWLKKGKGNNKSNVKWWPVLLPADQDALEAVNDRLLQRKSEKHVIVRYLGMKVPHSGEIETVHSNNLFPFDHVDQGRRQQRSTSRSKSKRAIDIASASASTDADIDASASASAMNSNHNEATTKHWSQPNMDNYLKRLRSSILSKKDGVELDLLTEQVYLQLLLEHVLECEQKQQERNNDNNKNANESDESEEEEDDLVLSASPDDSKAHEDELFNVVTCAAQVTQDEESTSPQPPPPPPPCTEKPSNNKAARSAKQVRVLRAGDVIEYCPHNLVNNSANRKQAVITQVMSKKDTFCLELHDGALLQADHQIKLVQRLIRGKLQDNADAVVLDVGQFRLDASGNGKLKIETVADQMSDVVAQCNRRLEQEMVDIMNEAKPFQSVDANASKRGRDEENVSSDREGSVSRKKTKGGLQND